MAQLSKRRFLRTAVGLFVPAWFGITRADMILCGPIMRPIAAGGGGSAPAYDNAISTTSTVPSAEVDLSITIGAGANRIAIIYLGYGASLPSGINTASETCLFAGQPMISVPSHARHDGVWTGVDAAYQLNPPSGSQALHLVTFSYTQAQVGIVTYSGVNQSAPFGTPNGAVSTANKAATANITSATGELVISSVFMDSDTLAIVGGNSRFENENIGSDVCGSAGDWAGAASVTVAWNGSGGQDGWSLSGIPLKPA